MLSVKINNVCIPRVPSINQFVSFFQCLYYAVKILWYLDDIYVRKCEVIMLNLLFVMVVPKYLNSSTLSMELSSDFILSLCPVF